MGLGAVAGLFCVDLRKSSYLREQWGGSAPVWPRGHYGNSCVLDTGLPYMDDLIQSSQQPSSAQPQVKTAERPITEPGAEFPVSLGSFPLAICLTHGGVYTSGLLSLSLTPHPLPRVHQGGGLQGEGAVPCPQSVFTGLYDRNEHNSVKRLHTT